MNDGLDGPSRRGRGSDGLDAPPRRPRGNDALDAPPRIPRGKRGGLDEGGDRRRGGDDLGEMDSSLKLEPLRRTASGELENSFSLGGAADEKVEKSWKHLDTVHKKTSGYADPFGDSDSCMEDSFAGSSFASNCDSVGEISIDEKAKAAFQTLDDEPRVGRQEPRVRSRPTRTYSKQKPKPLDTMVAISETEDAEDGEGDGDGFD